MTSACLLITHGSRDPRPQVAVAALAQRVQQLSCSNDRPDSATHLVETATLELAALPLHAQIQQFAQRAIGAGYRRLKILPLFLLPGVHVMDDIPHEVATAKAALGQSIAVDLLPYLGSHANFLSLLRVALLQGSLLQEIPTAPRILLSHGSRRLGGNQPVEMIAANVAAIPAYWSVPPNLETQIATLAETGCQQIEILPYFLFAGAITDAIAQSVADLDQRFPLVQLHLAEPLGYNPAIADLIADLLSH